MTVAGLKAKRIATSIEGTLTGLGGNLIVIDDPLKLGDAMSEAVRARVIEWYRSTLLSRGDDKTTTRIVAVMQRVHQTDLVGYLQVRASIPFERGVSTISAEESMHPPKYKALEETAAHCVAMGNDCLRHCLGMYRMKDTSMALCADAAFQLVAACAALNTLAAVNSEHTGHLAKVVEMICNDFKTECDKFPKIAECKACGDLCKACADECRKVAA